MLTCSLSAFRFCLTVGVLFTAGSFVSSLISDNSIDWLTVAGGGLKVRACEQIYLFQLLKFEDISDLNKYLARY